MSTIDKERLAIVVVTLLLLWSADWTLPALLGAAVAIPFFCWFVGHDRPAADRQRRKRPQPS